MYDEAPGSVQRNRATVEETNVTSPAVRFSSTSYDATSNSRALAWASSRVMFMRVVALSTKDLSSIGRGTGNPPTPGAPPRTGNVEL
jgi:hypothetical protein